MAKRPKPRKTIKPKVPNLSCKLCGERFWVKSSELSTAKYCSRVCKVKAQSVPRGRIKPQTFRGCIVCGKQFAIYPSCTQRYCSYACHLASGGALRAGLAASLARMRYGNKKDANHNEIELEFRKHGACAFDMSGTGRGVPDLMVGLPQSPIVFLVEIKNPKTGYGRRGLNKFQEAWAKAWKGGVHVCKSKEDVAILVAMMKRWHAALCADALKA